MVAVAVLGAGALGAGAQIFGANTAASAQENAANTASNTLMQMYQQGLLNANNLFNKGTGIAQSMFGQGEQAATGLAQPFISAGQGAIPLLQSLMQPGNQTQALSQLPGFQFQSQWGTQAATNALAARGLGGSTGPVAKAVSDYNQGLAGNTFFPYLSAIQGLVNTGSGAASGLGSSILSSATGLGSSILGNATNLGTSSLSAATGTGSNLSNNIIGAGNAQAAGILGTSNAIGGFGNSLATAGILNNMQGGGSGLFGPQVMNPQLPPSQVQMT